MSRDLTDALRRMMEEDKDTNVVPSLKPRGAAPAAKASAPLGGGGASSGVGSPFTETAIASRTYWGNKQLATTDGLVVLLVKPVKKVTMTDATGKTVEFNYAEPAA